MSRKKGRNEGEQLIKPTEGEGRGSGSNYWSIFFAGKVKRIVGIIL